MLVRQSNASGPRIFATSKLLTGANAQNPPFSFVVNRARDAASAVDDNPLENLATLRHSSGVMMNGRWISYERQRAVRH